MDADDLTPRRQVAASNLGTPRDLTPLSLDDLASYITDLEAEIARAKAVIAAKRAQRSGAEGLFRR
ncbi:MAG TPA: DUF1192 domain-containing protein [Stellaceae bacterium]|nr:DUF1192 domain-containing protein [Stellaceae bacterium]